MNIAIDARWCKKSGIGAFIDGILPHFLKSENYFYLIGIEKIPETIKGFSNFTIIPCDTKPFSLKENLLFPKEILKTINNSDAYFSPYFNIPRGIKIPIFTTIHDVVFLDIKNLASTLGTLIRKKFYKYAAKKSRAIFTVSYFSKRRIQENLKTKTEIDVVYSSVPEFFLEKENRPKKNQIIFIGNIKKHKGLHILIPAFLDFRKTLLENRKSSPELLIVGSKENFRTNDNSLFNFDENKSGIKFSGFISDEELKKELTESRLLVQPSLYEGFGLPPLEALYSGTKPIISDIEVFKEIYKDFPVTFFQSGNIDNLTEKLLEEWKRDSYPEIESFPKIYSFEKTASMILETIGKKI